MTEKLIPEHIDPFRFAELGLSISGTAHVADMQRLSNIVLSNADTVTVDLQWGVDEQGTTFLKGNLKTQLTLQCQRCMEPFKYEIIGNFLFGLVQTEKEAEKLPERFDPLVVEESLVISDLIEEELIVSLPIVPMHNMENCKVALPFVSGKDLKFETEKDNPFKVIELLRSKRDK